MAREEERRRIRRDLHDGLGPSLSGVVYQLESALLLVDKDPSTRPSEPSHALSAHVQDVVADVRRLVHDLRPPALDDRGLIGALTQHAEQVTAIGGSAVTVQADDLGALPAAVEVAAYRIVNEALTNVVRHAGASRVPVRLVGRRPRRSWSRSPTTVAVSRPRRRSAWASCLLRERAAELGGRSEVTCPPGGGTTVRAWLPLRPEEASR